MTSRRALRACLLALAYLALALVFTYPLASHFGTHHVGEVGGDAKAYLWNYWWVEKALFELGTSPFETKQIFYPVGIGLSLHTLASLQGLLVAPLEKLVGPVRAPNLLILWTFVASALATYALARRVGATQGGAFLAGIAFAFCPYRLARLAGHYDLLGTEWIPLYVLLLIELCERPRQYWPLAALTGLVAALCGYTALSYLVFLGLFTLLWLGYRREQALLARVLVVGLVVLALMAPLLLQVFSDLSDWSYPPYPGADRYVADIAAFVVPPPQQTIFGVRAFADNLTETTVFPGFLLLVLAALGWRHRFWALAALFFFVLSLGSSLHIAGADTGLPLPFWLISKTPLLENLRAPSRFTIMMMLSLAMMMALRWSPKKRWPTALAAVVLVAEYLAIPTPLFRAETHEVYAELARDPSDATVVEIPGIEQSPPEIMDHQRTHGKPIFVGTAARVPREKSEYYLGLPLVRPLIDLRKGRIALTEELLERERAASPHVARFLGLGYFVIDKAYAKRGVVSFVEDVLPVDTFYEDSGIIVLKTRREALPPDPVHIEAGAPSSRQHFESGWMLPEREDSYWFRWAHRTRSTLLFRRPPSTRTLVLSIAPLQGTAQTVSMELDGKALARLTLMPGWQELRIDLPPESVGVERLSLRWSELRRASEHDPRRLAARVRAIHFN